MLDAEGLDVYHWKASLSLMLAKCCFTTTNYSYLEWTGYEIHQPYHAANILFIFCSMCAYQIIITSHFDVISYFYSGMINKKEKKFNGTIDWQATDRVLSDFGPFEKTKNHCLERYVL